MSPDFTDGLLWYVVFLYSTVCHETAHAWTAFKLGDDTAYRGGQVSLDPLPHIRREPMGMVVVPLISFLSAGWMLGWASAPYPPQWALRNPRHSAIMALAGPAANFAIMALASPDCLWPGRDFDMSSIRYAGSPCRFSIRVPVRLFSAVVSSPSRIIL